MAIASPAADAYVDRLIVVRTIGAADLRDALAKGWDDFKAMPTFALFLAIIYPIIGLILFRVIFELQFAAVGLPPHRRIHPHRTCCRDRPVRTEPASRAGSRRGGHEIAPRTVFARHRDARHRTNGDLLHLVGRSAGHLLSHLRQRGARIDCGVCPPGVHDLRWLDTHIRWLRRRLCIRRRGVDHQRRCPSRCY